MKRYWFVFGLIGVLVVTLLDGTGRLGRAGSWLGDRRGPDVAIIIIFFLSGLVLNGRQLKIGLADYGTIITTFVVIFVAAPVLAVTLQWLPMATGVRIGLYIVALMPTTLSSGVVMTTATGGNTATALTITIGANILATFSVPYLLPWLAQHAAAVSSVDIDRFRLMARIGMLVLAPLAFGLLLQGRMEALLSRFSAYASVLNQMLILFVVWIAAAESRATILESYSLLLWMILLAALYHGLLVALAMMASKVCGIGPGRREAVIFMGGQKTLALSILIQMSLFPQYGAALAFCLLHHFIHLVMDGYLVERLRRISK